jgi:hypothetical protein
MTLTLMKCNFTMALLWCVRDCSEWIEMHSKDGDSPEMYAKAKECIHTCMECLEAFESSKTPVRGLLTMAVSHACAAFLSECDYYDYSFATKCIKSCKRCMEECDNLLAIRNFSSFFHQVETPVMIG